jgi:hypothetical protein
MSKYRYSLTALLASHEDAPYDCEKGRFVEQIASALYERYEDMPPISVWPQSVRYFYACYDINFQVGNGGFAQAAYNVPELIPIALEAFEHFECKDAIKLLRNVIDALPNELSEHDAKGFGYDETLEEVFEHFASSDLSAFDEDLPEDFWVVPRLQRLIEENRQDFASVDSLTS